MSEEYGETQPFLFFTDFYGDLAKAVREGRAREFEGHADHEGESVPDPNDPQTFARSKLNREKPDTPEGQQWLALTRRLLQLRQQYIVPLLQTTGGNCAQAVNTVPDFLAVRWYFPQGTLSLALNLGDRPQPIADLPGETVFA